MIKSIVKMPFIFLVWVLLVNFGRDAVPWNVLNASWDLSLAKWWRLSGFSSSPYKIKIQFLFFKKKGFNKLSGIDQIE